jgi:hypothetical protein
MSQFGELEVIVSEILGGEGLDLLKILPPKEKEVAWDILQKLRSGGESTWLKQLWQLDYDVQPPTPEQFFSNPEYFKHVGDDLYPKWREQLNVILDPARNIHEAIFRGCIGSGKTYVGAGIICYDIALLLHLKNPQRTLGLTRPGSDNNNSPIFIGLVSSDLSQLEKMLWNYTLQMMKRSPFFRKHSNIKEEKGYKELLLPLPKNIWVTGGSLPAHILGLNLYDICMDESNYRRGADPQQEAYDFYLKARNRVENRFINICDKGRIILISSEGDEGSFIDKHCRKVAVEAHSDAHICRFSEWEIKGHLMDLSGATFKVDVGDKLRAPHILEEGEVTREGAIIIDAPVEYRKTAERNLIEFLKERAGITPGRANKFFYNIQPLMDGFQLENPVLTEVAECALDTPYDVQDHFDFKRFLIKIKGVYRPLTRPEAKRFLHIDLAKNEDLAGISMMHVGDYSAGGSPVFCQDFVLGLRASLDKPIDYDKIIKFVKWLRDVGFNICLVTYDSYQSQHSLNILEKEGFNVKLRSLDILKQTPRGKVQLEYYEFRTLVSENRVRLVKHSLLRRESIELQDTEGKPDHPENGSKDLIDATVGATSNAIELLAEAFSFGDNFGKATGDIATMMKRAPREPISDKQMMDVSYEKEDEFVNP